MKKDKITLYIEGVNQYLKNQYGEVKPEWGTTLMVLEDTLRRYEQIKEAINTNGIYDPTTGKKNMLLASEKDYIATILKISQKLGISPWDASKIKNVEDDDSEDFIESLTNGE